MPARNKSTCYTDVMDDMDKIKADIERLTPAELEQLGKWVAELCVRRATPPHVEKWLKRAVGAAIPGVTTDDVMKMTRGED